MSLKNTKQKTCPDCSVSYMLSKDNWYLQGRARNCFSKRCRKCRNIKRLQYKRTYAPSTKVFGFMALPEQTRKQILTALSEKKSCTSIAKLHGIKYPTFMRWKRTNQF